MFAGPLAKAADDRAADDKAPAPEANSSTPQKRKGGFRVKVPQSPELTSLPIGYIWEQVAHPRPASRLDYEPQDAGIAGAKMGIEENNAGGRFTGHDYSLDVNTVASLQIRQMIIERSCMVMGTE